MPLPTVGAGIIADRLYGIGTPFDNTNAYVGIGNGTTAFAVSQADLQGSSTVRIPMETGYPNHSEGSGMLQFKIVADENTANFSWNEWAVFNASSGGEMLNRIVEDNGAKVQGQSWTFTCSVTFEGTS